MAIIKCPKCGFGISDKAANCVHCGAALSKEKDTDIRPESEKSESETPKVKNRVDYAEQFIVDEPQFKRTKDSWDYAKAAYRKVRSFLWWTWELLVALVGWLCLRNGNSFIGISLTIMFGALMISAIIVLNALFEYYPKYKYVTACMSWIKKKGYDLYDYINEEYSAYVNLGNMDALDRILDFTAGYYYSSHADKFVAYKRHLMIRAVYA